MCLAVPGLLLSVTADDPLTRSGKVSFGGVVREVNLACVPEAKVGDYLIVHVGLALSVVDEARARETLAAFARLAELDAAAPPATSPTP